MTPADLDLARRAVACAGWRWVPRMVDQHGRTVIEVNSGRNEGVPVEWTHPTECAIVEMYERPDDARAEWADALPDFDDDATRGCLLALVREARHAPLGHTVHVSGEHLWAWRDSSEHFTDVYGKTEAAALVAALEAACQE